MYTLMCAIISSLSNVLCNIQVEFHCMSDSNGQLHHYDYHVRGLCTHPRIWVLSCTWCTAVRGPRSLVHHTRHRCTHIWSSNADGGCKGPECKPIYFGAWGSPTIHCVRRSYFTHVRTYCSYVTAMDLVHVGLGSRSVVSYARYHCNGLVCTSPYFGAPVSLCTRTLDVSNWGWCDNFDYITHVCLPAAQIEWTVTLHTTMPTWPCPPSTIT
jgi:hypothetical protein